MSGDLEREIAEIEAELPQAIRLELSGTLPAHQRGKRLMWLYGRLSYLHELLGRWDEALAIRDEGEAALELTPLLPPPDWATARERVERKRAGHR